MRRKSGWLMGLLVGLVVGACGSDSENPKKNICERACDKVETCPGQQCTLNFDVCDSATQKVAECVLATPCDQLASCI